MHEIATLPDISKGLVSPIALPIPRYLAQAYWWAYVHPRAVYFFERKWLVNLILFGNYDRLCKQAVAELSTRASSKMLQIACVYGDLTEKLRHALAPEGRLDIVDILPIQLSGLAEKMTWDNRVSLFQGDSSSLAFADESYDQVLIFFLLHEQPPAIRLLTLAEAMRVVRPGGKIVIVDYHRPPWWHPLRPLTWMVFRLLEPFAIDWWRSDIDTFLPPGAHPALVQQSVYFGGLYQKIVITR